MPNEPGKPPTPTVTPTSTPSRPVKSPESLGGCIDVLNPNHWSKDEKYDAENFLEGAYKKHLGRHANK